MFRRVYWRPWFRKKQEWMIVGCAGSETQLSLARRTLINFKFGRCCLRVSPPTTFIACDRSCDAMRWLIARSGQIARCSSRNAPLSLSHHICRRLPWRTAARRFLAASSFTWNRSEGVAFILRHGARPRPRVSSLCGRGQVFRERRARLRTVEVNRIRNVDEKNATFARNFAVTGSLYVAYF